MRRKSPPLSRQKNSRSSEELHIRQGKGSGQKQYAGEQNIKALTDRIGKLQQQEDNLLAEIGQIDSARETARRMWLSGTTQGYYTDPREAQLPLLRQRLDNVRADRERVRQELQQAQRQP